MRAILAVITVVLIIITGSITIVVVERSINTLKEGKHDIIFDYSVCSQVCVKNIKPKSGVPKIQIKLQTNLHYRCNTNQINKLLQYFLVILVAQESQG